MECWSHAVLGCVPITPVLHHSNTATSILFKLPGEVFDEAALFQLGDEAAVHERFRLVVPDIRAFYASSSLTLPIALAGR
jgi:hypothetical protein